MPELKKKMSFNLQPGNEQIAIVQNECVTYVCGRVTVANPNEEDPPDEEHNMVYQEYPTPAAMYHVKRLRAGPGIAIVPNDADDTLEIQATAVNGAAGGGALKSVGPGTSLLQDPSKLRSLAYDTGIKISPSADQTSAVFTNTGVVTLENEGVGKNLVSGPGTSSPRIKTVRGDGKYVTVDYSSDGHSIVVTGKPSLRVDFQVSGFTVDDSVAGTVKIRGEDTHTTGTLTTEGSTMFAASEIKFWNTAGLITMFITLDSVKTYTTTGGTNVPIVNIPVGFRPKTPVAVTFKAETSLGDTTVSLVASPGNAAFSIPVALPQLAASAKKIYIHVVYVAI